MKLLLKVTKCAKRNWNILIFILVLFFVTFFALNYTNLSGLNIRQLQVNKIPDNKMINKWDSDSRSLELNNNQKNNNTLLNILLPDKLLHGKSQNEIKNENQVTRLYAIDQSGLGDNSKVIQCDNKLEVELVSGSEENANFTYFLNAVPSDVTNKKLFTGGKRHCKRE